MGYDSLILLIVIILTLNVGLTFEVLRILNEMDKRIPEKDEEEG